MPAVTNTNAAVRAGNGLGPKTTIMTYSGDLEVTVAAIAAIATVAGVDTDNAHIAVQGTADLSGIANTTIVAEFQD